jgi:hypothetical protein
MSLPAWQMGHSAVNRKGQLLILQARQSPGRWMSPRMFGVTCRQPTIPASLIVSAIVSIQNGMASFRKKDMKQLITLRFRIGSKFVCIEIHDCSTTDNQSFQSWPLAATNSSDNMSKIPCRFACVDMSAARPVRSNSSTDCAARARALEIGRLAEARRC